MKKMLILAMTMAMVLLAAAGVCETLRVGMECNYAPYNWTQSDASENAVAIAAGGYADGYDVRIAKIIADQLGMELEIVKTEWDGLTPALLSGNIYGAVFVAIYILAMQQIDGNIIQPRIVSNSVGIKAIYVLLAITIGGGFFGFWGIFLGVPFMAMVQMLVKDFIEYRKRQEEQRISAGTASGNGIPPEENGE